MAPSDLDLDETSATPGVGHNSGKTPGNKKRKAKADDGAEPYDMVSDELRQFCERYEQLEAEKRETADQQKELLAELKARGFDPKIFKKIIAERKRDADDLAEEAAVLEIYRQALGMEILKNI